MCFDFQIVAVVTSPPLMYTCKRWRDEEVMVVASGGGRGYDEIKRGFIISVEGEIRGFHFTGEERKVA